MMMPLPIPTTQIEVLVLKNQLSLRKQHKFYAFTVALQVSMQSMPELLKLTIHPSNHHLASDSLCSSYPIPGKNPRIRPISLLLGKWKLATVQIALLNHSCMQLDGLRPLFSSAYSSVSLLCVYKVTNEMIHIAKLNSMALPWPISSYDLVKLMRLGANSFN